MLKRTYCKQGINIAPMTSLLRQALRIVNNAPKIKALIDPVLEELKRCDELYPDVPFITINLREAVQHAEPINANAASQIELALDRLEFCLAGM